MTFAQLSDHQLVARMPDLLQQERSASADFVEALAELDARKLYLGLGFTSVYSYCAARLHLTDGSAYRRIEAARASRRFPAVLAMLKDGSLSLATAALVSCKLTTSNADQLLKQVSFKSKRDVELVLARLNPQPPVASVVRKLPEPRMQVPPPPSTTSDSGSAISLTDLVTKTHTPTLVPSRRPVVAPLSESHYRLQITISSAARKRLQQIQDLMRHRLPNGDPAAIVEHALELLHADLLKKKTAEVN